MKDKQLSEKQLTVASMTPAQKNCENVTTRTEFKTENLLFVTRGQFHIHSQNT